MKKSFSIFVFILLAFLSVHAQQNLSSKNEGTLSPVVNADNTVTFHLSAPNALSVELTGDWDRERKPVAMQKNQEGMWTYTTPVLASDLYIYRFTIDGTGIIDPRNVYQIRDVNSLFSYFVVEGGQGGLYQVRDVPHGTVSRRWYDSPTLGKKRRITVYTPPGYEKGGERYPVLYLLHGMGGDEEAWISLGRTAQILDNLIAKGDVTPMIVVMPNGNAAQEAAPGESQEGQAVVTARLPHAMDGTFENSFKDIISFIEENYRVKSDKNNRAIAGLSMGGFHSLWISANNPDLFGYVGLFSPAVRPRSGADTSQGVPSIYENMDGKLIRQRDSGLKLYWIAIGEDDFLIKAVEEYRNKLKELNFPFEYVETEKGHIWSVWRLYLTRFCPMLFKGGQ